MFSTVKQMLMSLSGEAIPRMFSFKPKVDSHRIGGKE